MVSVVKITGIRYSTRRSAGRDLLELDFDFNYRLSFGMWVIYQIGLEISMVQFTRLFSAIHRMSHTSHYAL